MREPQKLTGPRRSSTLWLIVSYEAVASEP
jgi:hypothetical protein